MYAKKKKKRDLGQDVIGNERVCVFVLLRIGWVTIVPGG